MASRLIRNLIPCLLAALAGGCSGGGGGRGQKSLTMPPLGVQAGPASIRSFSPPLDSRAAFGELVMFKVTLDDSGDQSPEFSWSVDGMPVEGNGIIMFLETRDGDPAVRWVEGHVSLGGSDSTTLLWRLQLVDGPVVNAPPAIQCAFPAGPLSLVSGELIDLSIHADDPDARDVLNYRWSIDDRPSSPGGGTFSLDSAGLGLGSHAVRVYVKDDTGIADAAALSFDWDVEVQGASANRPPIIVSASPACPVRISSGSSLELSARVQDFEGDPLTYRWELDGTVVPESGDSFLLRTGPADVRERIVRLTVTDSHGAQAPGGSYEWKVMVAQPPTPDLDAGTVTVDWNGVLEDVNGNPENVEGYRVYAGLESESLLLMADVGRQTEATLISLRRGLRYRIAVSAYDRAGNESGLSMPLAVVVP